LSLDKYASGEASQDNCEAYLSFCESNYTLPQAPFTVYQEIFIHFLFSILHQGAHLDDQMGITSYAFHINTGVFLFIL
jgi:hypothetical protein